MSHAQRTVCRYYLQGICRAGTKCRWRHNVPGLAVISRLPPSEEPHDRAMALLVDGHIKATFAAGIVPDTVEDFHSSKLGLRIEGVNTSVTLRWSPPTRTLLLRYDPHSIAHRACASLNRTRLMGVFLNCAIDITNDDGAFTLQIFDLPWPVSDDMILNALPSELRLDKKDITSTDSPGKNSLPKFEALREAVARLANVSPTHMKEGDCSNSLSRLLKISFEGSPRLDGVARALDGQRLELLDGLRIQSMEIVEVQLVMDATIYERYRGLLKSCAHRVRRHSDCDVRFDEENSMPGAHVQVLLSGTDREALTAAKRALDKVLIDNTIGRLSAPPKPLRQTHRIVFTKTTDFLSAIHGGGMRRAQDTFGHDIVYLETSSSPAAIMVRGDACTLRKVQRYLSPDGILPQSKKVFCEVCWDEADDIVKVDGCRHAACKDCFVQYCTLNRDNKFPLRCFQTNCKILLQVHEVRLALGEDAFHRLLSEAIETHFRQNPANYTKCPGPDCASFSASDRETNTCPACFTTSCRDCQVENHFGETCEQYQERMSDSELQKWMEKEGAKNCPRCNGVVQKASGCNHMTCALCQQHFCFACLEMFNDDHAVYAHMAKEHGTYYANQQEEREANERAIRLAQGDGDPLDLLGFGDIALGLPVRFARPDLDLFRADLAQARRLPAEAWARPPPRMRQEIDEELARQELFAELWNGEDLWVPLEEVWEDDAGVGARAW